MNHKLFLFVILLLRTNILSIQAQDTAFLCVDLAGQLKAQKEKTVIVQSHYLSDLSQQYLERGDAMLAMMFALEALPKDVNHPDRPYVMDAEISLRNAAMYTGSDDMKTLFLVKNTEGPAVYSIDGKKILTAGIDRTAYVWDAANGKKLAECHGHTGKINSVTFSADGHHVLTASDDLTVRMWDAATGKQEMVFEKYHTKVLFSIFSPDGKKAVTVPEHYPFRICDATTGKVIAECKGHNRVTAVVFSADGKKIASASEDRTARVWDSETGATTVVCVGHAGELTSVAFDADGKRILTASADRTARVWDAETGKEITVCQGHQGTVKSAVFSPDGRSILTGSTDKTACIWDAATGEKITEYTGHSGHITSAVFSPDGETVLTSSLDGTVRRMNVRDDEWYTALEHHARVASVVFSPDGRRALTVSMDGLSRVWDIPTGKKRFVYLGVGSTNWTVDGRKILTRPGRDSLYLYDAETDKLDGRYPEKTVISPDFKKLLTQSDHHISRIINAGTGKKLATLPGKINWEEASFSSDGKRILTVTANNRPVVERYRRRLVENLNCTAHVWDATNGKRITEFTFDCKWSYDIKISPDGKKIALQPTDSLIRLWDAATGKEYAECAGHKRDILYMSFSADSKMLVTTSYDGTARVWDTANGKPIAIYPEQNQWLYEAIFSPDSKQIAINSDNRTIRIWDIASGKISIECKGHTDIVSTIVFSLDGNHILTASKDMTARIWNVATGKEVITCKLSSNHVSAVFSPDGKKVFATTAIGMHIFDFLPLQELINQSREYLKGREFTAEERGKYFIDD